ncbi:hypothetical protein NLI96_g3865 [Meripilus lineatus]|uniref:DUF6533 domain-containing protein n=1 Tax=Meripilus lineatus TaxID=2056292 RepID=A0AAD5V625_9APHY|nr:hypothetical protein NLI96_g3865 [Physisporinus lineatus]
MCPIHRDVPRILTGLLSSTTTPSQVTIYVGFASFTMLVWDHFITFDDEVNYVWKGNKGPTYLSPVWTSEVRSLRMRFSVKRPPSDALITIEHRCEHFVRYEGSMTVIGINTTALMMLLRIYAMYPKKWYIVAGVAAAFCVELGINAWLLTHGTAVVHHPPIHACTMIFDPSIGKIASASAWLPLLYDTIVVLLTLYRTVGPVRHQAAGKIMRLTTLDPSVIFTINLILILMINLAPPGLQNITAQTEYLLTVAMMSRITLHLKKQGRLNDTFHHDTWATFSRATSAAPPSALRFAANPARRDAAAPHVNITVQELITRDDERGYHHEDTRRYTRASKISIPPNDVKSPEWHEMSVARKV